jgi:hypothetical protein
MRLTGKLLIVSWSVIACASWLGHRLLEEATTCIEAKTIDMVLLSGEYQEVELTVFALDARHPGFQGLILRAADVPSQISLSEQQRGRG